MESYQIESSKPFGESLIWQLNQHYYQKEGIDAWRKGTVPHNLTSSSMVGKTYAKLIFAFLKDLAAQGQVEEKVYLLELGAGHGRLAFHILQHLEPLIAASGIQLPPYCYVLTDIVEKNLLFFLDHPQFQPFLQKGILDVAYLDGLKNEEIYLRYAQHKLLPDNLSQPLVAIANYFFDSLPMDLFQIRDQQISACSVELKIDENPEGMSEADLLKKLRFTFEKKRIRLPFYAENALNEILEEYLELVTNTHLFIPQKGLQCIQNLRNRSQKGLMLISMDKGFHEVHDLDHGKEPIMITHGSMSFSVNYHAMGRFCEKMGGKALFPSFSTFNLELACLLFLPESERYTETYMAYRHVVDDYGPDDFIGIKKYFWMHLADFSLVELLGFLRLGAYDSDAFRRMLPYFKDTAKRVTFNERTRLSQSIHQTWYMYFNLKESIDLAFEMGGILYGLGFYRDALQYFQYSVDIYGDSADSFYNKALCYYQLREDDLFVNTLQTAKLAFPDFKQFAHLDKLNLQAK